jgi:hypothetical protein
VGFAGYELGIVWPWPRLRLAMGWALAGYELDIFWLGYAVHCLGSARVDWPSSELGWTALGNGLADHGLGLTVGRASTGLVLAMC